MSFLWALKLLEAVYFFRLAKRREAFPHFERAGKTYYFYHMPFLLHYPFVFVSPYFWYALIKESTPVPELFATYIYPLVVYTGMMFFFVFLDKYHFYSQPPTLYRNNPYFGVKSSLLVSANMILFFFHPLIGWIAMTISFFTALFFTQIYWAEFLKKPLRTIIAEYLLLSSAVFFLTGLILAVYNLFQSFQTLKKFGIL